MKKGDIVINPWVSRDFEGKLNPLYATIYVGNNKTIDYKGRLHNWCNNLSKPETWEREWRVIGRIDLDLYQLILNSVIADEAEQRYTTDEVAELL